MDFDEEANFLYSDIPINEEINNAVKKFAEDIINCVKINDNLIEIYVSYVEAQKIDNSEKSIKSIISTKYGLIHILPDFKNGCARASIINRGLIYAMELEGYTKEEIKEAEVYGTPFEHEHDKIEIIGRYLTSDLGIQHQRGWAESI